MCKLEAALFGAAMFFAATLPAMADGSQREVPEPNVIVLLALASAGILIGRRMAVRKPPRD